MTFSIISPVYNVAPYLRECLDLALAQAFTDWEAICVTEGLTDATADILDMSIRQRMFFERTSVFPIGISIKYWLHSDFAVRKAAQWMTWLWARRYLRVALYPVILLKHSCDRKGEER